MPAKTFMAALAAGALVTLTTVAVWAQVTTSHTAHAGGESAAITKAIAVLHPTKIGGEASGTVTFTHTPQGVRVRADIHGLTPGAHGFHIHEFGDCSSPDGMSTGGHFNPTGAPHADRTSTKRHIGDLGNIEADANLHASITIDDPALAFSGPTSILGRGLIVHEKADDLKSQPAGNAGGRVLCGVIGVANASPTPTPAPATSDNASDASKGSPVLIDTTAAV